MERKEHLGCSPCAGAGSARRAHWCRWLSRHNITKI